MIVKYPQIMLPLVSGDLPVVTYVSPAQGQEALRGVWSQTSRGRNVSLCPLSKTACQNVGAATRTASQRELPRVLDTQSTEGTLVVSSLCKAFTREGEASIRRDSACSVRDVWRALCLLRQHKSEVPPARSQEQRWRAGTCSAAVASAWRKLLQVHSAQAAASAPGITTAVRQLPSRQTLWWLHGGRS